MIIIYDSKHIIIKQNLIMKKAPKDSEYRRIKVDSDYSGFDFFLLKKPLTCCVKIPETILLDKNGAPRDWIFNSNKLPSHPILKKRKENLLPFAIIRNFCSKHVPMTQLAGIKTIPQLKEIVRSIIMNKKDAQYASKKKHIEIRTIDNQILQINILQFLQYIGQNKFAQQNFYDKWRMIQQRVSTSKLDESYIVQSVRRNHLIQSKSSKYIAIGTGNKVVIDVDSNDAFKQAAPSKELQVTQTKMVEGYKFFDTYLNKKFFSAVGEIIDCIEKNYKCIVQSMTTRFVIDHNREPHLAAIQQIYLKPSSKLFEMREFTQQIVAEQMKLDNYTRCLMQYIIQNPAKPEPNLEQPVYSQRGKRCRGEFCDLHTQIPHIAEPRMRLPMLPGFNTRKMSANLIESVKKRRGRVIEKLKENGVIDPNYNYDNNESSQYEESDNESQINVRVCENCFIFYVNVLRYFEVDGYGNLVQKRASAMRSRTLENSQRQVNKSYDHIKNDDGILNKKDQYNSLKTLQNRMKVIEDEKEKQANTPTVVGRSLSQHARLRPIGQKVTQKGPLDQKQDISKAQKPKKTLSKEPKDKPKVNQIKSNKLIDAKLKNITSVEPITNKPSTISKTVPLKKHTKPTNFYQAAEQLMEKLEGLSNSNEEQFIFLAKKYYKDNLPQFVDRVWHSSQYLTHLYEFMSNSPIGIAPNNRIKKRPQMTLKRLSELTGYPQIVSRSAFIFDTIICDEKSTIPFCVISSKMVHNRNQPGKPYQNIIIINDIFDSYIESISMVKQILQEVGNTRFILFNYHGQSHTIYDKQLDFKPTDFSALIDKLIYRLSSQPNQLNIVQPGQSYKLIGMGYGGSLVQSYLSLCPEMHSMINGIMLVNSSPYCTKKSKEIYSSLLQLYSVPDPVTEQNAFLFYNKAINSIQIEKQDLENKSGLNSIKIDGRAFLLKNALNFWNDSILSNFEEYKGNVLLLYSRGDILLEKGDMQRIMFKADLERTQIKGRSLKEIDGGHDITAQNYDDLIKNIFLFIQQ